MKESANSSVTNHLRKQWTYRSERLLGQIRRVAMIAEEHRLGVRPIVRVFAPNGKIGLTSEVVQKVSDQDAIVRQRRLIQKTRRTKVQPRLDSA